MISEEPRVALRGLYPIGEAAAALGISRNTLRKYAEEGFIKFHVRRMSNRKLFKGSDLLRLWSSIT